MANRTALSNVLLTFESVITNTRADGLKGQARLFDRVLEGKLESGDAADEANRMKLRTLTLLDGVPQTIDLADMGLDALQQAVLTEALVTLLIKHTGTRGSIEIQATVPANPVAWAPSLTVANGGALKAGGVLLLHQPADGGLPVLSGASSNLRLQATGADATAQVYTLSREDE